MKKLEEIVDGVYLISMGRSNAYLLAGRDLTLVDTGMPGEEENILEAIKNIGRSHEELNHILITHAHMDHMGSAAAVKKESKARIVASAREADYVEGLKKTWTMGRDGMGGKLFRGALFLMETFLIRYEPARVDIRCNGGELIDCFGGIRVVASPGHSPGSLSYYHSAKRILFSGDALSGAPELRLPPRPGCADYHESLNTVRKLAELDFELCLFGHGAPLVRGASAAVKKLISAAS